MRRHSLLATSCWFGLLLGILTERAVAERRDPVVATIGRSQLTTRDIERRLTALPAFQLTALAGTVEAAKRRYVQEVLVRELLLDQAASDEKLEQDQAVAEQVRARLAEALVTELERELERDRPVTDEEVHRAFEAEQASLGAPRRLRVFRILVGDEAEARKLIGEAHGTAGLTKWATLARERSLDKATNMRSGDLGFVRPDGSTDVPGLRVDPALFSAAERVADGALVPDPVKESDQFAVIWRRGSLPAERASFEQRAPAIRQRLSRQRLDAELSGLVDRLRKERVTVGATALVDQVVVNPLRDFPSPSRARAAVSAGSSATPGASIPWNRGPEKPK
jgi:peptidyl-prolyl cis-trans isomerase C